MPPFVRTTKPMLSPGAASAAAEALTVKSAKPPGLSAARAVAVMLAPVVAACDWIVTDQLPAPLPASLTRTIMSFLAAPATTLSRANESDEGLVKICGSSARPTLASPAPCSVTAASCVRAVLAHAGPAVDITADLTCSGVHVGWCWRSSATAPATCGAAMLVPSKTANGEPANSGNVEERIAPPGAATSGFSRWPNAVGPAEEKLVTTPLRLVAMSS